VADTRLKSKMFEKHSPEERAYYQNPDRPKEDARLNSDGIRKSHTGQVVVKLTSRHHEALRMAVLGYDHKEIARVTGMAFQTLGFLLRSPVALEQLDFLRGAKDQETYDVAQQIKEFLPKCVQVLTEVIEDEGAHDALRSKNALALLAIGGHGPTRNLRVNSSTLDVNDLMRIKQRAIEMGLKSGTVIDAEFTISESG